jgi:Cytochrome c
MKKIPFPLLGLCLVFLMSKCQQPASPTTSPDNKMTATDSVKRGEYLVQTMGCNDCHSPKKMGARGPEIIAETMLSGYPADRPVVKFENDLLKNGFAMFYPDLTGAIGPWGTSFAANLTPDETGLGNWTFENFNKAMTQGKAKGMDNGRMLLPPMPWVNYVNMKDEDLKAIFAYLKSIPAVKNVVPAPIPLT